MFFISSVDMWNIFFSLESAHVFIEGGNCFSLYNRTDGWAKLNVFSDSINILLHWKWNFSINVNDCHHLKILAIF